jgi:large repetitive protein
VSNGGQVTDAIYTVNNNGNTVATYVVKIFDSDNTLSNLPYPLCSPSTPAGTQCTYLQLMLAKQYLTPVQDPQNPCNLAILNNFVTGVNVVPSIVTNTGILGNTVAFDPNASNATITLAPGETGFIILRSNLSPMDMQNLIGATTPVVVAHAANTGTATPPATLAILSGSLPAGIAGQAYNTTVNTFGGIAPYSFSFLDGSGNAVLNDPSTGLAINPSTGTISGNLPAAGSYSLEVRVTDSATVQSSTSRMITLKVVAPLAITTTMLPSGLVGLAYNQVLQTSGGTGATYTWSTTGLPSFLSLNPTSGILSLAAGQTAVPGVYTFTVSVADPGPPAQSTSKSFTVTFTENTSVTVTVSPNPTLFGTAVTVTATVLPAVSGSPGGSVSVTDTTGASCTITLVNATGTCQLTPASAGPDTLTATYAGDGKFNSSSGTVVLQVAKGNTTTTVTSSPNPATLNQPITVSFTVVANSPAVGTPTGTVTVTDTTGASCSATLTSGKGSCSLTPKAVGSDTVTATYAGDTNFNTSAGTLSQALVLYRFTGFFTPLGPAGTYSGAFNFGKVVPVKWQLTDNNGNIISSLSSLTRMTAYFNGPAPASGTCPISTIGGAIVLYLPTSGAAGNSTFRFSSNQFVFNWDTSSADPYGKGCFTLSVQLNDGSGPKVTSILLQ